MVSVTARCRAAQVSDRPASKHVDRLIAVLERNAVRATEPALVVRLRGALEKLQTKDDGERA
jgi:hypothetical protein